MRIASTQGMSTLPASTRRPAAVRNENALKGDHFAPSGNDDSIFMKSLVGGTIGGLVSMIPATALLQNGVGSSLVPAAVIAGGALLGGVLLANANVEIGFAPG